MAQGVASHVLQLAERHGADLEGYKVICNHLKEVKEYSGGQGDITGIYGAVRMKSGLRFEI
jgi:hypothetical protein